MACRTSNRKRKTHHEKISPKGLERNQHYHRRDRCDPGAASGRGAGCRPAGVHRTLRFYGAYISHRSLIYVKKVDPYTIEPGQPITFMLDENAIATHRVVGIVPDEEDPTVIRFRTKGDANDAEDGSLVHYKNVIGTPVFSIPYLGYVADYIQHPPGLYIAISAGAVLLLLVFLPDIFAEEDDKEQDKTREKRAKKSAKRGKAAHDTAVKAAEPAAVEAAEPAAPEEPADAGLTDAPTEENDDLLMVDDVDAICREFEAGRFGKD